MAKIFSRWIVFVIAIPVLGARPAWADEPAADADQAIIDLYKSGKLFDKREYQTVRAAFARQFEQKHQSEIQSAYGEDAEQITAWLKKRPDIKENLYTALNEKYDNVEAALRLFKELWKQFPEQVDKYSNVAVATAVTWDDPRGVYNYRGHQLRTKSSLPTVSTEATDNFKYLVDNDKSFQGRIQLLPWEFLVLLVDHRTPLDERKWSQSNYQSKRVMVGRCYKEVPYDHELLNGNTPHLSGQVYTLENIRRYGGVCAHQADFAARVAKSLGIPAAFVGGQADTLGLHAWVMWVEFKQVTKTQIQFTLESFGRYLGDHYYTGELMDPQTGQRILDRDLERRLSVVGHDRVAKRQADLIMRAYSLISDQRKLNVTERVSYLDQCLRVSGHNEEAWLELAQLAKNGDLKPAHLPTVSFHLNNLFKTFAQYPDFVWKIFDDLLTVQPSVSEKARRYEQLVAMDEQAGRPDLACGARLKLAELQCEQKKWKTAANGLAFTIKKFPSEGRYVPRLMEKLQEVCANYKGGTDLLAQFYLDVLPTIPGKRGNKPSQYCIKMYEQAIAFFKENHKDKVVPALEAELARVKNGQRK
jgi:hypothetical protein